MERHPLTVPTPSPRLGGPRSINRRDSIRGPRWDRWRVRLLLVVALCAGCADSPDGSASDVNGSQSIGPATAAPVESASETTEPAPTTTVARPASSLDLTALRPLPPAAGIPTTTDPAPTPVGLRIGSIGVGDGPIIAVGVERNGELSVPEADEVGWYRFGSSPGQAGSTVLAAHIAYDGVDGVFRHLSSSRAGDEVEVELSDGSILRYEITEVVEYLKSELPSELFSETGPDRLVLITCGGDFNPTLRSYPSNVVALAVRR